MIARYEQRAADFAARRDAQLLISKRIARVRLATFLPGAALVIWSLAESAATMPLAAGLTLLAAFGALVVWHARVDDRAAWYESLHGVNQHAIARIGRAWDLLPAAEPPHATAGAHEWNSQERDLEHHPYALDLDLFGRASLMQWLGPAATAAGTITLQRWLLRPADAATVKARQAAVEALAPALEWRERLAAHGRLAAGVRPQELEHFLRWGEGPGPIDRSRLAALGAAVWTICGAIWILIALHAAGIVTAGFWLIPVAVGMTLSFATAAKVHGEFQRAGAGQHAFVRYADLFTHALAAPAGPPHLAALRSRLGADGMSAPGRMRQLNRILGFAKLASGAGIFHFGIQALTLWDFHVFFALERWRRRVGPAVRGWMDAVGELDALSAFAQIKADNPEWSFPSVQPAGEAAGRRLIASRLGHPLIHAERRVVNDVEIGPPGTLLLITGSNMSGKSTLLRAIGLNAVLAHAGAPVCASSITLPPLALETSLRVQDSLEHGLSYFMAALARLKGIVDRSSAAEPGRTVLYLLDEILQGTNTAERAVAIRGVARHLLRAGAIGAMTTHDLAIAQEEPIASAARLAHFTETVDEHGAMSFDYRLRPGLATSRNALRLMQLMGIDVE
jgi:hypothetical protein